MNMNNINNFNPNKLPPKGVSFKGKVSPNAVPRAIKALDCEGKSISLLVSGIFCFGIVLGARLLQARDKDERREVATRDFCAVATITFAVPFLRKSLATLIRKFSGVSISHCDTEKGLKRVWAHMRPREGVKVLTMKEIGKVFSKVSKMPEGLVSFSNQMAENRSDLKKVFEHLSKDGQASFKNILKEAGKESVLDVKDIKERNGSIIDIIKDAKNGKVSDKASKEVRNIETELDKKDNELEKFAERLRSIPDLFSYCLTGGVLGWLIPWFNIRYTKALYKKKAMEQTDSSQSQPMQATPSIQPKSGAAIQFSQLGLNTKQKEIFAEFKK